MVQVRYCFLSLLSSPAATQKSGLLVQTLLIRIGFVFLVT